MSLEILKKYKIRAKKGLWQNFLVNEKIVEEIANIIPVKWQNIIEVWPWYWALTEKILDKKPASLNLVELDKDMVEILENRVKQGDFNLNWVDFVINNTDVLKFEPLFPPIPTFPPKEKGVEHNKIPSPLGGGLGRGYSVIANIPYYITSPILRHFLYEIEKKPEKMLILMQKDVWDKIIMTSPPTPLLKGEGSKKIKLKSSVLWLFIAKKSNVKEVLFVWKQNFVPAPKIESSVLLFEIHDLYNEIDDEKFLKIIKAWFWSPRKKLSKNLENLLIDKNYILNVFNDLSLENNVRWEDLSIAKWCELIKKINI